MTSTSRRASRPNVNEHAQLWYYRSWAEWMAADSWLELLAYHPEVPDRVYTETPGISA